MGPLIPKYIYPRLGYMPVYTIGVFVISLANLSYGFCSYLPYDQKALFISLNICIRLFQGMGVAFVYQTCFTVLCLVYKDNLGRVVAMISFATTLGVAVGPTLAGILYSLFGYIGPFFTLGSLLFIFALFTLSLKFEYNSESKKASSSKQLPSVTYTSFCKNKMSLVSLIAFFMRVILITFYEPTLAVKLQLVYGFDSDESAYFYTLQTLFAFLTTVFLTIMPIKTGASKWTAFGLFGAIISLFLMGPSVLLRLPENIYIMATGTGLMGIFAQNLGIACVISCAESMKEQYEGQDQQISEILGSLRVSLAGLAFVVSPFYASTIENLLSYSILCDSIAIMFLVLFISFLCVNRTHQRTKWIRRQSSLTELLIKEEEEN